MFISGGGKKRNTEGAQIDRRSRRGEWNGPMGTTVPLPADNHQSGETEEMTSMTSATGITAAARWRHQNAPTQYRPVGTEKSGRRVGGRKLL